MKRSEAVTVTALVGAMLGIAAGGGLEYLRAKAKRLGVTSASKERAAER